MRAVRILAALALIGAAAHAEGLERAVGMYLAAAEKTPEEAPEKPKPKWELKGNVGLTVSQDTSKEITATFSATAKRNWENYRLFLRAGVIYGETNDVETDNEWILVEDLAKVLEKDKRWIYQYSYWEYDSQEKLNLRLLLTAGYKWAVVNNKKIRVIPRIGAGWLYEEFRDTTSREAVAEFGWEIKWVITEHLTFTQTVTWNPVLGDASDFRLFTFSTFSSPLGKNVNLLLSIRDNYDTTPRPGVSKNDLNVILALSFEL